MATDLTRYQVPDVYVTDVSTPIVTTTAGSGTTVAIVGPALGFQKTAETVKLYSARDSALVYKGIIATGSNAPVVTTLGGTALQANIDYALSVDAGTQVTTITRLASGSDPTDPTKASPNGLIEGASVKVVYSFTAPTYYEPATFDNVQAVFNVYGAPFYADGTLAANDAQVQSALSLGAQLAFAAGASQVVCVPIDQSNTSGLRAAFSEAYTKLLTLDSVGLIVPLWVDGLVVGGSAASTSTAVILNNLISDVRAHCEAAYNESRGRIALVGTPSSYDDTEQNASFEALAGNTSSSRVVLLYPPKVNVSNAYTSQTVEVSGFYLAAAAAGRLSANALNRGLTRQVINGIASIPASIKQRMTLSFMNSLSASGVAVLETDNLGRAVIRHGTSTDVRSLSAQEISLTRIGDRVNQRSRSVLQNAGLIGEALTDDMPLRVRSILEGVLEAMVRDSTIIAYDGLTATVSNINGGNPTVIECQFAYRPALPINYIQVTFSMDLTSGVSTTETTV